MILLKANKSSGVWAHNYCVIAFMKSLNSATSLHFNSKLEALRVKIIARGKVNVYCSICKNKKMLESIFKVRNF